MITKKWDVGDATDFRSISGVTTMLDVSSPIRARMSVIWGAESMESSLIVIFDMLID